MDDATTWTIPWKETAPAGQVFGTSNRLDQGPRRWPSRRGNRVSRDLGHRQMLGSVAPSLGRWRAKQRPLSSRSLGTGLGDAAALVHELGLAVRRHMFDKKASTLGSGQRILVETICPSRCPQCALMWKLVSPPKQASETRVTPVSALGDGCTRRRLQTGRRPGRGCSGESSPGLLSGGLVRGKTGGACLIATPETGHDTWPR